MGQAGQEGQGAGLTLQGEPKVTSHGEPGGHQHRHRLWARATWESRPPSPVPLV